MSVGRKRVSFVRARVQRMAAIVMGHHHRVIAVVPSSSVVGLSSAVLRAIDRAMCVHHYTSRVRHARVRASPAWTLEMFFHI